METTDYQDPDASPEKTTSTSATSAAYAVHLAQLLCGSPFPPS